MVPTSFYTPYTFALYNLVLAITIPPPALFYAPLYPPLSHAHKYCIAHHVELPNKPFSMCSSFFHMRSSSCSSWFRSRLAASRGRHSIRSEDGWLDDCLADWMNIIYIHIAALKHWQLACGGQIVVLHQSALSTAAKCALSFYPRYSSNNSAIYRYQAHTHAHAHAHSPLPPAVCSLILQLKACVVVCCRPKSNPNHSYDPW